MFNKKLITLALFSMLITTANANDLTPEKYAFINGVLASCSNGIEECPDDEGIETLVSNISQAESDLSQAQATLAATIASVSTAQDALADTLASDTATAQDRANAQSTLTNLLTQQTNNEVTVSTIQGVLDDYNADAA